MIKLLSLCEREGIRFDYEDLDPKKRILGVYFRDQMDRPGILLHEAIQHHVPLARTVLGEEVGHHMTLGSGTLFVVDRQFDALVSTIRNEKRAIRWAAEYFMPLDALAYAVIRKGLRLPHEFAEYFSVTEWLVHRRIEFLRDDIRRRWGVHIPLREVLSQYHARILWGEREPVLFVESRAPNRMLRTSHVFSLS